MEGGPVLEIRNLTPFPLTWAHVEQDGVERRNLLAETLAPRRGILLEDLEPARGTLVLAFDVGEARTGFGDVARGPEVSLLPGAAWTAAVRFDPDRGFAVRADDARVYVERDGGGREDTGRYRWSTVEGRLGKP